MKDRQLSKFDEIKKPEHYNSHPSGVECIQVAEHMTFCIGNVIKYCWRAGLKVTGKLKNNKARLKARLKDLRKAHWYLNREIEQLEREINAAD